MKKEELLSFATTWVYLKGITLSEISSTGKGTYCMITLIYRIFKKKKKLIYKENRPVVAGEGDCGGERNGRFFGCFFFF